MPSIDVGHRSTGFGWDEGRDNLRAASHVELERRESRQFVDSIHHVKVDSGQHTDPAQLVSFNMKSQGLVDCFVSMFTCTVSLWMVSS